jgi:hypothetical protein
MKREHAGTEACRPAVDWVAVEILQNRRCATGDAFRLNALDKAIDDLIERPARASHGAALAANAYGSARKAVKARREVLTREPAEPPPALEAPGTALAARMAASMLSGSLLRTLPSRTPGGDTQSTVAGVPESSERQRRRIRAKVRMRVHRDGALQDAVQDLWRAREVCPEALDFVVRQAMALGVAA